MQPKTITAILVALCLVTVTAADGMETPKRRLLVPWFEVGPAPTDPTTIFAVRNVLPSDPRRCRINYHAADGTLLWSEVFDLAPQQTFPRNVRHVLQHLPTDSQGRARGYISLTNMGFSGPELTGDYFQIDPANAFAVGSALVSRTDWCQWVEIRFLEGGGFSGGTELFIHHAPWTVPSGEPSFYIHVFDEAGSLQSTLPEFASHLRLVRVKISDLAYPDPVPFGFLRIQFNGQNRGTVTARMDALGQYSIAMEGACVDDLMPSP